jgi:radical SAM protein with 4Fe4S-binding SPASM domain
VSNNPYICETFDFFEKLQLPFNIVFAYISENKSHQYANYDNKSLITIKEQLDRLLTYYMNKLRKRDPIYSQAISDYSSVFRFRVKGKKACSAGIDFFTITANGDIFSCSHLMNEPKYAIGNININFDKNYDYVVADIDKMQECAECWAQYLCKGGCFAQKISMGKTNCQAKQTNDCELERLLWQFYMKLYYHVMQIAPEYFKIEKTNANC